MNTIDWGDSAWKHSSLIVGEEGVSLQRTKVCMFSDSVLCLGKMNENPIKLCTGRKIGMVQKFIRTQNLGQN